MMTTMCSWKNLLGGLTPPPNLILVTNIYYASYYGWAYFNKARYNTNTTLPFLGKNKFIHLHLAIPFPGNSGVKGIWALNRLMLD